MSPPTDDDTLQHLQNQFMERKRALENKWKDAMRQMQAMRAAGRRGAPDRKGCGMKQLYMVLLGIVYDIVVIGAGFLMGMGIGLMVR